MRIWLVIFCLTTLAWAQPVEIKAEVDKSKAEVGQSLRLTIDLLLEPGVELTADAADKYSFPPFEVRDASRVILPQEGKRRKVRYSFKLAAFEEGKLAIGPAKFPYRVNNGPASVQSQPLAVEVIKVPAGKDDKPGEIRDLKGADLGPLPAIFYALAALTLLLVVGLILLLRKAFRRRAQTPTTPALPPYEQALRELDALERERLPEQRLIEPYYDRLTGTLRNYLSWRYQVPMLERTSSEILADLRQRDVLEPDQFKELKLILEEADLVKFARFHPLPETCQERMETARRLLAYAHQQTSSPQNPPGGAESSQRSLVGAGGSR